MDLIGSVYVIPRGSRVLPSNNISFDPALSNFPRVENTDFPSNNLLIGAIEDAYRAAEDRTKKEVATSALFEVFFQTWLSCRKLSVISQQNIDQSNQAPDLCVGYWESSENGGIDDVFVMIAEFKRARHKDLRDLESELKKYAEDYLSRQFGGKAKHPLVYGATAFGTKTFFRCFYGHSDPSDFRMIPLSGREGFANTKEDEYWDLKTDGEDIHKALREIWEFRYRLLNRPPNWPERQ
ncbi:hypothetical protein N7486_009355 [Penicillium sp. IBT 16267x]|nr:hypothetical protein N7486_009355 [Penicillium sp. IBT 16267x]